MMTQKRGRYIKLFHFLSGLSLVCCVSPHLNILCMSSVKQYYTKIIMNLSDDIQFLYTSHSKFTINATYDHLSVKTEFNTSILCYTRYRQTFLTAGLSPVHEVLSYLLPEHASAADQCLWTSNNTLSAGKLITLKMMSTQLRCRQFTGQFYSLINSTGERR